MLLFTLAKVAITCSVPMSFSWVTDGVKVITSLECRVNMAAESENQRQGNTKLIVRLPSGSPHWCYVTLSCVSDV